MTYLIIGTAGHVDHGKTMLVKALTGVDTDRLKEEKERGISIELGFASLTLPSGRQAGIVDVPGHERFIKNMLAGVGGIDLVLLVIAADEGIMPQTKEHMDIIHLLQIPRGVVVLSKVDLVDREWLDLVREEVVDFLKGTTLEGAPVVEVSSVTGQGLDELLRTIDLVAQEVKEKPATGYVRLPVDRVFSITGFGTVATGTLWSGILRTGDALEIMPRKIASRVRTLQVHGRKVEEARAGQRVAVNLTGVEIEEVPRGSVLATPGSLTPSYRLDVRFVLLETARPLKNRSRVRLHLGTAEIMCRVILLDRDELAPQETALAQLELEEPAVAVRGDRFVVRSYSPVRTIGGGKIIDPVAPKHRRLRAEVIESLLTREKGTPEELLLQQLNSQRTILTAEELVKASGLDEKTVKDTLFSLVEKKQVRSIPLENQVYYLLQEVYLQWAENMRLMLQEYHRDFPLREGFPKEEMRSRLLAGLNSKQFQSLLQVMEEDGLVKLYTQDIALPEFTPRPNHKQEQQIKQLIEMYREANYQPPAWGEAARRAGLEGSAAQEILQYLLKKGLLVRVADDLYFHPDCVDRARQALVDYLREKGEITVGETRDLLQTSRKYALPLLEYFDREKTTRRVEDKRVLTWAEKQKNRS
ncbi:selenocysteine-specific translation elongation factor [Desulfofundulus thermosubterraneus]|uniref:Selenocysteine-specific elongation factor n=1 Tax=Desulfofundulus thermosubterraneus DSM 16057 TaxID=1121432 RepID=A0A1M6J5V9_9FIRM|nr:selenocysteine-specific translation elongation factor [Desulfofundulus thermosubterraneus]SHJ42021.1 selenocysteine-specific elongation factor [Desulfofundulus thermosubterraneus DSM 16057]